MPMQRVTIGEVIVLLREVSLPEAEVESQVRSRGTCLPLMGLASAAVARDLSAFLVAAAAACSRKDRFCLLVLVDLVVRYFEKLSWW